VQALAFGGFVLPQCEQSHQARSARMNMGHFPSVIASPAGPVIAFQQ
jgi:hypothetical protein